LKALSVNSYDATFILEGEKIVECRSWKTDYRGDLLICSNSDKNDLCLVGKACCICELIDIKPFTKKHLKDACMDKMPDDGRSYYAWELKPHLYFLPFKIKGKLNIFDVNDDLIKKYSQIYTDELQKLYPDADKYLDMFFDNIIFTQYHHFNKTHGDIQVDNDFINNFMNITGFTVKDIWDDPPKTFKCS
jgi:hypothetical protein